MNPYKPPMTAGDKQSFNTLLHDLIEDFMQTYPDASVEDIMYVIVSTLQEYAKQVTQELQREFPDHFTKGQA
jgi:hypothetical protein